MVLFRLLTVNYVEKEEVNYLAAELQSRYPNIQLSPLDIFGVLKDTPLDNFTELHSPRKFANFFIASRD